MAESENNYQQIVRDIQLMLQQQEENHLRQMQLLQQQLQQQQQQQLQQLREELLPQQREGPRSSVEPLPQVQGMDAKQEEAKPPRKRGVAAGRSRRMRGYRGGQGRGGEGNRR
ncbi:mediator of RNA polymerase II transcription subunit 25-like [Osmia bicornis bicornis]|uniref:mediator of RNA polymerase II transcription subunit 25-like n=1 Tax=Osmia bicornis bicornis TaxID=1437191 RepID=UPI001EAF050F|nr:mediator of RNA polymerase II transcription subunit 25-like [Osmia bicornis bicornis]